MQPTAPVDRVADPVTSRWWTRRALLLHLAVIVWVPGCALACFWQVTVALSGDSLGWLYSIEWPAFGIFGLVVWWNLIHDDPPTRRLTARRGTRDDEEPPGMAAATGRRPEEEDDALAKYNDYLESLARSDRPKTWRRR